MNTNCIFIGIHAGVDIIDGDGIVIIGDGIRDLSHSKNKNVIFVGEKVAIGKTVLGEPCNLYDILKKYGQPAAPAGGEG